MKTLTLSLFTALLFSSFSAFAVEYVCSHGDAKRVISVAYENEQEAVPCEVQYDKGEGAETLWNAQAEVGYCETKASEFVEKQESWGWSCHRADSETSAVDLHSDLY